MESPNRFTRLGYQERRDKWTRAVHPRLFFQRWIYRPGLGDFAPALFPLPAFRPMQAGYPGSYEPLPDIEWTRPW